MSNSPKTVHASLHRLHRLHKLSHCPALSRRNGYATQSVFQPPTGEECSSGRKAGWRDSASLILTAPSRPGDLTSLPNFLITKRSKGSSFAPNILCFPGGQVDVADCHPSWINLFGMMSGTNIRNNVKFLNDTAIIPNIYGHRNKQMEAKRRLWQIKQVVPTNISLRITAIRETFEECGILLCCKGDKNSFGLGLGKDGPQGVGNTSNYIVIENPDELEEWQMKVKKDPMEFQNLCKNKSCFPDINALVEWSNWLTPNSFGDKRFDTLFYMAVAPVTLPFLIDPYEVATARWTTALDVLKGAGDGKAKLIPPQIYELTRLRNTNLEKLRQLMKTRLQLGVERCCPCYIKAKDGILSVFPGDDLYPLDYNIDEFEEIRELDQTREELRESTSSHHRIEFTTEFDFRLIVNVGPSNGQIYID